MNTRVQLFVDSDNQLRLAVAETELTASSYNKIDSGKTDIRLKDHLTVTEEGTFKGIENRSRLFIDEGFTPTENQFPYFPFIYRINFKLHRENFVQHQQLEQNLIQEFFMGGLMSRVSIYTDKIQVKAANDFGSSLGAEYGGPGPFDQVKVNTLSCDISNNTWYDLMCIFHYPNKKIYTYLNNQLLGEVTLGSFTTTLNNLLLNHIEANQTYYMGASSASVEIQNKWGPVPYYTYYIPGSNNEIEFKNFTILEPFDSNSSYTPPIVPNPFTVETNSSWS